MGEMLLLILGLVSQASGGAQYWPSPAVFGQGVFGQQRGQPESYATGYAPGYAAGYAPSYASGYEPGYAPGYAQGYAPGYAHGYGPPYSRAPRHGSFAAPDQRYEPMSRSAHGAEISMNSRPADAGPALDFDFSSLDQVAKSPEFAMELPAMQGVGERVAVDLSAVEALGGGGRVEGFDHMAQVAQVEDLSASLGRDMGSNLEEDLGSSIGNINYLPPKLDTIGNIPQISSLTSSLETALQAEAVVGVSDMARLRGVGRFTDVPELSSSADGRLNSNVKKQKLCTHPELGMPSMSGMIRGVTAINFTVNIETRCPLPFAAPVRPIDGSCGHPDNLGAAMTPLRRLMPAQYADGQQAPKQWGVTGRPLPSPRLVSKSLHTDVARASQHTIMLMQWGQLMDHEMVSTPLPIEETVRGDFRGGPFKCCGPNKTIPLNNTDPECFPILFPGDNNFKGQCMEFVRSMPVKDDFDEIKLPRENMNMVTSFIDASTVYGSSEEVMAEVRANHGRGHLLRLQDGRPVDNGKDDCIKRPGRGDVCYLAGDERVNEHPGLAAMHTVLMRLHNRWAQGMRDLAPWMTDEQVFQKTRSLVQAVMQKIMYNEWLPVILGEERAVQEGLFVRPGEYTAFDSSFDPRIFQGFSSAAFRFGHTLIPKEFFMGGGRKKLRDLFFKPYLLFESFDEICINLVTGFTEDDRSQDFDRFIVEEVTNHLFENEEGKGMGFDLIALNLQRARDHGLPSYNDYREFCGLHRITDWQDEVWGEAGKLIGNIYDHPDDVELFSGGINERPAHGGFVGETFSCLFVEQLKALKFGDQFFFSHWRNGHGFTPDQFREITSFSLAHLMCQTTKIRQVQPNALLRPGPGNELVSCDDLLQGSMNLKHFVS